MWMEDRYGFENGIIPIYFDSVGIPIQNIPDFFALDIYPLHIGSCFTEDIIYPFSFSL